MSEHAMHNRHHRRRRKSSGGSSCQNRPRDEHKMVNKISPVDIWASDRLYDKLRPQVIANRYETRHSPGRNSERQTLLNCNATQQTCQGHGGSGGWGKNNPAKTVTTKMITRATIIGGDTTQEPKHECHKPRTIQSRSDEFKSQEHRHQHRRHLSSETVSNSHHCYQQEQNKKLHQRQPDKSSDMKSSQPTWESSAARCMQRGISYNGREVTGAPIKQAGADRLLDLKIGCMACRDERHRRHGQTDMERGRKQCLASRPGKRCQCYAAKQPQAINKETVGAIVTHKSPGSIVGTKIVAMLQFANFIERKNRREKITKIRHANTLRLSSNSTHHRADNMQSARHCSVDRRNYLIDKNKTGGSLMRNQSGRCGYDCETQSEATSCSCNIARIGESDQRPVEQVKRMAKPVVWLVEKQPSNETLFDWSRDSRTSRINKLGDNRTMENEASYATAASNWLEEAAVQSRTMTKNSMNQTPKAEIADALIGCNNSKSLQMLSKVTNEHDVLTQSSSSMTAVIITTVKKANCTSIVTCHIPQIRMQSNAIKKSEEDLTMSEDLADVIQTQQVVGESVGVEPKTDTSSSYVQDAVLKATILIAAKGFAGLVRARTSDLNADVDSLKSDGSDTVEDSKLDKADEDDDDLDEEDESDLDEEFINDEDSEGEDDDMQTPRHSRHDGKWKKRGNATTTQGGDEARNGTFSKQQADSELLPMTECPATQHRIECFRTRSGKVKCYMTARHPVKCRVVKDGRIMCKATANPETSDLSYPCSAAWQ